jgi:hypothetical protein
MPSGGRPQLRRHAGECFVDQQNPRFGVLENISVFGGRPARIERHGNGTRPGDRIKRLYIKVAVEGEDRNAIAKLRAKPLKSAGRARNAPADLFPGPRPPAMHGTDIVLAELDCRGESLRQFHVSLPLEMRRGFFRRTAQ